MLWRKIKAILSRAPAAPAAAPHPAPAPKPLDLSKVRFSNRNAFRGHYTVDGQPWDEYLASLDAAPASIPESVTPAAPVLPPPRVARALGAMAEIVTRPLAATDAATTVAATDAATIAATDAATTPAKPVILPVIPLPRPTLRPVSVAATDAATSTPRPEPTPQPPTNVAPLPRPKPERPAPAPPDRGELMPALDPGDAADQFVAWMNATARAGSHDSDALSQLYDEHAREIGHHKTRENDLRAALRKHPAVTVRTKRCGDMRLKIWTIGKVAGRAGEPAAVIPFRNSPSR